mmetsp:Transcript_2144/g.6400  ORF Transcript_2144/g.6400 Transcript_2144/m.6400 type:complete len:143 (+) Transcript_2144:616-1044(+)
MCFPSLRPHRDPASSRTELSVPSLSCWYGLKTTASKEPLSWMLATAGLRKFLLGTPTMPFAVLTPAVLQLLVLYSWSLQLWCWGCGAAALTDGTSVNGNLRATCVPEERFEHPEAQSQDVQRDQCPDQPAETAPRVLHSMSV